MTIASSLELNELESRFKPTATTGDARHSQFGIKAKLFLAFFALAGLTALASLIAWYVFRDIDRAVTRVTVESVPGIITALSSAEKSAEIAATAPAHSCWKSGGARPRRSKTEGACTRASHPDLRSHRL